MAEHAAPTRKKEARQSADAKPSVGRSPSAANPYSALLEARAAAGPAPIQRAAVAPSPNRTGLPDRLKAGVEALSGVAMDDVRVHRNSAEPAKLGALAYAQGTDIHLAAGQEQHLPHEAWHVVQQKQGRVRATSRVGQTRINDDAALEAEASALGARALQGGRAAGPAQRAARAPAAEAPVQKMDGAGAAPAAAAPPAHAAPAPAHAPPKEAPVKETILTPARARAAWLALRPPRYSVDPRFQAAHMTTSSGRKNAIKESISRFKGNRNIPAASWIILSADQLKAKAAGSLARLATVHNGVQQLVTTMADVTVATVGHETVTFKQAAQLDDSVKLKNPRSNTYEWFYADNRSMNLNVTGSWDPVTRAASLYHYAAAVPGAEVMLPAYLVWNCKSGVPETPARFTIP